MTSIILLSDEGPLHDYDGYKTTIKAQLQKHKLRQAENEWDMIQT